MKKKKHLKIEVLLVKNVNRVNKKGELMKIEFGREVKDKITGFRGIVTGECSYISGCLQYLVQPKGKDSDKKPDAIWFDVDRLETIGNKIITLKNKSTNGFDLKAPIR
jgi:hypothetical protein